MHKNLCKFIRLEITTAYWSKSEAMQGEAVDHESGKRTKAKEELYRMVLKQIRSIHPNFNIGVTTGVGKDVERWWEDPYLHWRFHPQAAAYEAKLTKRGQGEI